MSSKIAGFSASFLSAFLTGVETAPLGGLQGVFASDVHVDVAIFHEGVVSVALKIVYSLARVRRWKSLLKRGRFTLLLYYGLRFLHIANPSIVCRYSLSVFFMYIYPVPIEYVHRSNLCSICT